MPSGPIVVYGATGYTGTLVAHELRRRGLDAVLAGRSAERLARLADLLGGALPFRAVELDDRDGLRHLLGDAAVVIDCAGPFVEHGEPVVRAAVETGTHYVDTTGEQTYMRLVHERYDDAARAAEVAVVPAMGFDYVPGDLLASVTAAGAGPLRELLIAYATEGVQPTRGTLRTALGMLREPSVTYVDGAWRPAPLRPQRARVRFPDPIGLQPVMSFPSGEVVTVPRHVRTRAVTTLMTVATMAGHAAAAPFVPVVAPLLTLALRSPLHALAEPLVLARYPEGPAEEVRRAARFTIVVRALGEDGGARTGVVRGGDVYGLTAVCAVHGAALMAADGFDRAGVLAPAQAFDPAAFLAELARHGVTYEV